MFCIPLGEQRICLSEEGQTTNGERDGIGFDRLLKGKKGFCRSVCGELNLASEKESLRRRFFQCGKRILCIGELTYLEIQLGF